MDGDQKVSMSKLRKELATFLRIANTGEQVIITVDGKPFAALGPIEAKDEITLDHLIAGGLVRNPLRNESLTNPDEPVFPIDTNVALILREMRG